MSIFKYSQLSNFLKYISKNYLVTSFENWKGNNAIILRHDVDFDLRAAYKLSLIEEKFHIKSTFFILMSAATYNPLSIKNRRILSKMSELGFEVGLHFDPVVYGAISSQELKKRVDEEAKILSLIVRKKVKSVSLHNPSITRKYPYFKGYHNAYDSRYFPNENYISDSRMIFKTDIYSFAERAKNNPIQILLHPLHYTEKGDSYVDIFCQFIVDLTGEIDKNFKVNRTYCQIRGKKLFDLLLERHRQRSHK